MDRREFQIWLEYTDFQDLARYNAEKARGLVHTPEWDVHMAGLQQRFDEGILRPLSMPRRRWWHGWVSR